MPQHSYRANHINGSSIPTSPAAKFATKRGRGFRLILKNIHATNSLDISFDSGANYFQVSPGETFDIDVAYHFFYVRGNGGAVDFTAISLEG